MIVSTLAPLFKHYSPCESGVGRSVGVHYVNLVVPGPGDGGNYRVLKRYLVSTMQVLLQAGLLKVAEELSDATVLVQELLNFQVKIDPLTAHDSYGAWREGQHDDRVMATAVACWYGQRQPGYGVW